MKYQTKAIVAYLVILIAWAAPTLFAQGNAINSFGESTSMFYGNGISAKMKEIPYPVEEELGRLYLHEDWMSGSMYLTSKQVLLDVDMRYDLENHRMEIQFDNDIKTLSCEYIREFDIYSGKDTLRYINVNVLQSENLPEQGFYRILVPGEPALLTYEEVRVMPLNGGLTELQLQARGQRKAPPVERKTLYFMVDKGKFYEFKAKKKDMIKACEPYQEEMVSYTDEQNLKCKEEAEIIEVFQYLNSM